MKYKVTATNVEEYSAEIEAVDEEEAISKMEDRLMTGYFADEQPVNPYEYDVTT